MQSVKSFSLIETLHVKNEVITIDEVVIESIKQEERVQEEPLQNSKLIYYFEPQEKSNFVINTEDKSKSLSQFT